MKCNPGRYDIILLDLYMPGTQPEENIRYLVKNCPGKPVVIYSTEESSVWKRKAFAAGVKGYISWMRLNLLLLINFISPGLFRGIFFFLPC
jgi:DNA-binding NarL/FixJ family response regulator